MVEAASVVQENGLHIERKFTKIGESAYATANWIRKSSVIKNPDGSIIFSMDDIEVPDFWSQTAVDVLSQKYLRKTGVPQVDGSGNTIMDEYGKPVLGSEKGIKQIAHRLAGCWKHWGEKHDYFASADDAQSFYDELAYMLIHQYAAPNSPQWFNTGLHWAYGISGPAQGHWFIDPMTHELMQAGDAYSHSQAHACFILSIKDDLVGEGGIMDLVTKEARIFKYGSGCTSGDSYIWTDKFGLIKIRDLFSKFRVKDKINFDGKGKFINIAGENIHTISMNKDGVLQKDSIERIWEYDVDKDDKLSIKFSNGARVTVSVWHPFLVWTGERIAQKRADILERSDTVLGSNSTIFDIIPKEDINLEWNSEYFGKLESRKIDLDEEIAWLIGYFIGDGSLGITSKKMRRSYGNYEYKKLRLRFYDETRESLEKVKRIVEIKFGEKASIERPKNRNLYLVTFNGRNVTNFFASIFKPGSKTYSVEIPEFLFKTKTNILASFLAGLMDSDGYVTKDGKAVYGTASRVLAEKLAVLSSLLGIGGGIVKDGNTYNVTIASKSATVPLVQQIGNFMENPRRRNSLEFSIMRKNHRSQFCIPLAENTFEDIFQTPEKAGGWLRYDVNGQNFHLGRLKYEGLVNPKKLSRMLEEEISEPAEFLKRICESACFVTSVEKIDKDVDFYDLTVNDNNNYLAGENSLVIIHNSGTNFSTLRGKGEPLSGGGKSSGLMSFLKIFDTSAGAIKSAGTTRRAAKMVILDMDHPEIEEFIDWKMNEEKKVAALVKAGYPSDYEGEAYQTVSGQNSNNSIRVPNAFMRAVINDLDWSLIARTNGAVMKKTKAQAIWNKIGKAAWASADPGVQFDDTINDWHTCPASGRQRGTNPCSEYLFLDNTACNLASLNLMKFYDKETGIFDIELYKHAVRLWTIVLEITVLMAGYPSKEIAEGSYKFRTLGLGFANLGAMLMVMGIPYDSDEARAISAGLTAVMTGESYAASAEMAAAVGPFPEYEKNREYMLRVIRNHRRIVYNARPEEFENLSIIPQRLDHKMCPPYILSAAIENWDRALALGQQYGYRNAQVTLIAPTGTIALVMDCDTTGIEPDFALVKFKKLAGGGYFKIINQSVRPALKNLGYSDDQVRDMMRHVLGTNSFRGAPYVNDITLRKKGFSDSDLEKLEGILPSVMDIKFALTPFYLGDECMRRLGFPKSQYTDSKFELLRALGFNESEVEAANDFICGSMTMEGAPHLKDDHISVFDCANKCGKKGKRFLSAMSHIKMLAAAQPLLSGSISKTINLPNEVNEDSIKEVYMESWKLGLKCVALYRDGSKLSQPLSNKMSGEEKAEYKPKRRRLPEERRSITHKFRVGNQEGYITVGLYPEGAPGEMFIKMSKQGSIVAGLMDSFATSVSIALQYGVPLKVLSNKFLHTRFEPSGFTDNPEIKTAKSIMDYIFRWVSMKFLSKEEQISMGVFYNEMGPSSDASPGMEAESIPLTPKTDLLTQENVFTFVKEKEDSDDEHGDAPSCYICGTLMRRAGTCYLCMNCGANTGC